MTTATWSKISSACCRQPGTGHLMLFLTLLEGNMGVTKNFGWLAVSGSLVLLVSAWHIAPAGATVMTMDFRSTSGAWDGNNTDVVRYYGNYGNRVTADELPGGETGYQPASYGGWNYHYYYGSDGGATPNVAVSLSQYDNGDLSHNIPKSYMDTNWDKILFAAGACPQSWYYTFSPDLGYVVNVGSFTLRNWSSSWGAGAGSWTLHADSVSGAAIASGNWTQTLGDANLNTINVNASSGAGQVVVLEFHMDAGNKDQTANIGFDNLTFSQMTVPEPGTLNLVLSGLIGLLTYAWRMRQCG